MTDQGPPDTVPVVYANWFRSLGSIYDIGLDLGYRVGDLVPDPDVRVVMSWEYAAALRDVLSQLVEQYEELTQEPIRKLGGVEVGPAVFLPER